MKDTAKHVMFEAHSDAELATRLLDGYAAEGKYPGPDSSEVILRSLERAMSRVRDLVRYRVEEQGS